MRADRIFKHLFAAALLFAFLHTPVSAGVSGKPDLAISLSDSPDPVSTGETVTYTIIVKNTSPDVAAYSVYVDFASGSSLSFVKSSGIGWICSNNRCTYIPSLFPGNTASTLKIERTAPSTAGSIDLTATTGSDTTDGDPSNNSATEWTAVKAPNLSITKSAPAAVDTEEAVTFTLTVKNIGDGTAEGVQVTDTVPSGFTNLSAKDCSITGRTVTCSLPNLDPGFSKTITITANAPAEPGDYDNSARVTANHTDPKTSNTATVHVRGADIYFIHTDAETVASGKTTTLTFQVENGGEITAKDVKLEYTFPDGFTNISELSDPNGNCGISGKTLNCDFGDIAAGSDSQEIKVTAKAPVVSSDQTYTKTAKLTTSSPETETSNDGEVTIPVKAVRLAVAKNVSPTQIDPAGEVTFTIEVTNNTGAAVSNISVEDKLSSYGFTFKSVTPSNSTCTGGETVTCSLGSLANGATETIEIRANAPSTTGNHTNTATATSANTTETWDGTTTVEVQGANLEPTLYCENFVAIYGNYYCDLSIEEKNTPDVTDANLTLIFPEGTRSFYRYFKVRDDRFSCAKSDGSGRAVCQLKSGETITQSEGRIHVATYYLTALDESEFDISDFDHNTIEHALEASTTLDDGSVKVNSASSTTYVNGANPSVLKTGPADTGPGHEMTYVVHVENWPRGDLTKVSKPATVARDVSISDTLPSEVTFVKAEGTDWSCTYTESNHTLECDYGKEIKRYDSDHSASDLEITVRVNDDVALETNITNSVTVTSSTKELIELRDDDSSTFSTIVKGAILKTSVDSVDRVAGGQTALFDINITNRGFKEANGIDARFDFDKPELIDTLHLKTAQTECQIVDKSVECNLSTLGENETLSVKVEADITPVTENRNLTARIEADADNADVDRAEKTIKIYNFTPYAEWRFDDCNWEESGSVKDEKGLNNGTAINGAHLVLQTDSADGNNRTSICQCGAFDGIDDYINVGKNINPGSSDITISGWFKWKGKSGDSYIFDKKRKMMAKITDKGCFQYIFYPHWSWEDRYCKFKVEKNVWTHFIITYDHKYQRLYKNGQLVFQREETRDIGSNSENFLIGARKISTNPTYFFPGLIDELKVFYFAVDDATANHIYQNELQYKNFDGSTRRCPVCQVDASVSIESSPKVYADNDFEYIITVANEDIYPINEINLSVDIDDRAEFHESNYTSDWVCNYDQTASPDFRCYFNAENDPDDMFQKGRSDTIVLKMHAPNELTSLTTSANVTTGIVDNSPDDNNDTNTTSIHPVDLEIIKGTDNEEPGRNQPYRYTLRVTNLSGGEAKDIEVEDPIDERLNITSIANNDANWSCGTTGHTIHCSRPTLPANHQSEIYIMVTSPRNGPVHNEANLSTTTRETRLINNSAAVDVDVDNTGDSGWDKSKFKDFTLRKKSTLYGDLIVIGNSNLAAVGDVSESDKLADINTTFALTSEGKSTAKLHLEPYMHVRYARLYWTGHLHGEQGDTADEGADESFKTVIFHTPDGKAHTLTADENDTYYYYYKNNQDTYRRIYSASVDVTDILEALDENNATEGYYAVESIKANTGKDIFIRTPVLDGNGTIRQENIKFGHFAGWNLIVFYEVDHRTHREQVFKDINIFDGFRKLVPASIGSDSLTIPVDEFITPMFGDTIDARLSLFAAGGEQAIELDSISMVSIDDNISKDVNISDALNDQNNILNGTISRAGTNVTDRNPMQNYNIGIDLDQFDISSDFTNDTIYFGHLQGETNVTLSVKRIADPNDPGQEIFDQSFPTAIGISTQIYNPDFIDSYKECFTEDPVTHAYRPCSETNVTRGGEIVYRITVINSGTERAKNLTIEDLLPKEVDFNESTADLKVVTNTIPLCTGLDTSYASIKECMDWLERNPNTEHPYFKERILQEEGKEYIKTLDVNASTNKLIEWDESFSDYTVQQSEDDANRTLLKIDFSNAINQGQGDEYEGYFPALHVTWIEFKVRVNKYAALNKRFENTATISFTNPTLAAFGYDAIQSQESTSSESPPVHFDWQALPGKISDPGRNTVGTKIAGKPFALKIRIGDENDTSLSSFTANYPDVNVTVWGIRLLDENNNTIQEFNRSDATSPNYFTIVSSEYQPIGNSSYWITDRNISLSNAYRGVWFAIQYKIRYKDGDGFKEELAPDFYGPFGDPFATRPEKFTFTVSETNGTLPNKDANGTYYVITSAKPFSIDINATAPGIETVSGYNTILDTSDIVSLDSNNTSVKQAATFAIWDEKINCGENITDKISLNDFNFTNGAASKNSGMKFKDVGKITMRLRDLNWTLIDQKNNDCNISIDNGDQDQNDSIVSCYIKGEVKIFFIPKEINVTEPNIKEMDGNGYTFMADESELDKVHSTITAILKAYNYDGNITTAFKKGCYADDVNMTLTLNILSNSNYKLLWKDASGSNTFHLDPTENKITFAVDDSNFTDGEASVTLYTNIDRNVSEERNPVKMTVAQGSAKIENYLDSGQPIQETSSSINQTTLFWYARMHAPDYRSDTNSIETPIYIEVYCNSNNCSDYNINNFQESSDDVDWWIINDHKGNLHFDLNATRHGINDSFIKIDGGTPSANLNDSFQNGSCSPKIQYDGNDKLHKTRIELNPNYKCLKYNKFFDDGNMSYYVEFNTLPSSNWSGIGKTGETVETNGSRKSSRRVEW
jgi:uncharacterized repeat protein (TIGR01451 family)/fimbrial isopeptide formation D2 family protein